MTRPVEFRPEALEELDEGARWYEERHAGLGERFVAEVRATVARIADAPEACTPVVGAPGVRGARVKDFQHRIYFVERSGVLRVLAVSHDARRPRYWRKRLRS
ncbi:MAG: type II toxin-antitoxin system RelE/ParE family toxin [Planctomycetes bacterium]|nr:type II toxin-antitoxin system RelE/ParE family toxin [Planctomycetota bacterium]